MAGGMKKFRVSNFELRTRQQARPPCSSRLATRNPQLTAGTLAIAAVLSAWPSISSGAQLLKDPTQPPPMIYSDAPAEADLAVMPVLQSVKISPSERLAIIGGERVQLGGKFGEARVIKITESEVVLRTANGTQTLHMYPGVIIKPVALETPAGRKAVTTKPAAKKRSLF